MHVFNNFSPVGPLLRTSLKSRDTSCLVSEVLNHVRTASEVPIA